MADFVQRTTAPDESNDYYYANNPFYQSGYGLPNCTCYAYGRFWELTGGTKPRLSLGNAENWYGYADGYTRGQTPKLGAIICWRKGQAGVSSDGAGHVEVVEAINDDGTIVTSGSGYNSFLFRTKTRSNDGNWGGGSAYTFQGFIYNPVDFDGTSGNELTYITGNRYLSQAEMETNARYIWNYLGSRGWTMNAVAGMLGNMQTESTINPGIWESLDEGDTAQGYGLVQWTPATKYLEWCDSNGLEPDDMASALERIIYELENGLQFYPTNTYKMTFSEFKVSTKDPYTLGMVFLYNYERPAVLNQPKRGTQAEAWYKFLSGLPAPVDPSRKKRKGLPLWLMYVASRRRV